MRKLLLLLIICAPTARATCNTSTLVTTADALQTCLNQAATNGGTQTVTITASSASISGGSISIPTTLTKLTVVGATTCTKNGTPGTAAYTVSCTDNTTFTCTGGSACIGTNGNLDCSHFLDWSGITLIHSGGTAEGGQTDAMNIASTHLCVGYRIHGNHFEEQTSGSAHLFTAEPGLVDSNYFDDQTSGGINDGMSPYNCGGDSASIGYLDWADPINLGTNNMIIFEDNYYNAHGNTNVEGLFDGYFGCKIAIRHNTVIGNEIGGMHGTDSGSIRSATGMEIYGNYVSANEPTSMQIFNSRGGFVLFWGNSVNQSGSFSFTGIDLQYFRCLGQNNSAGWGSVCNSSGSSLGLNWIPSGTNGNAVTLNAPDWQANHTYAANAVIGPTSNNSGNLNFMNEGSSCTSGGTRPATFNQTFPFGTTSDGTCTGSSAWVTIGGTNAASSISGAGFSATHPDTQLASGGTRFFDATNGTKPFRDMPCYGHDQVAYPCYEFLNTGNGISEPVMGTDSGTSSWVLANRDFYNANASCEPSGCLTQTTGTGWGTLAQRPTTCAAGVGYWATDTSTLYQCGASNAWTAYYTPYPYPDPLQGGGGGGGSTSPAPPTGLLAGAR